MAPGPYSAHPLLGFPLHVCAPPESAPGCTDSDDLLTQIDLFCSNSPVKAANPYVLLLSACTRVAPVRARPPSALMRRSSRQLVAAWLLALPLGRGGEECARRGRLEMISFWLLCWKLLVGDRRHRHHTPPRPGNNPEPRGSSSRRHRSVPPQPHGGLCWCLLC